MVPANNGPRLRSPKDWVLQVARGMCMGVADIIPGISGGTVAFIMGFYEDLLISIKSIKWPLKNVSWDFLLALLVGIAISLVTLANVITSILNHEVYRIYLYSIFMGLILASIVFCAKQVREWHKHYLSVMVFGAVVGFIFCSVLAEPAVQNETYDVYIAKSPAWTKAMSNYDANNQHLLGVTKNELSSMMVKGTISSDTPTFHRGQEIPAGVVVGELKNIWIQPWTMTCGVIGITALLLPGVSGSYVLNILGMYPIVIAALAEFVAGLKQFYFDMDAFLILANLASGVILGAILFSRVISWFLRHYHQATLSLLTGFLIGSIETVWPFWSYEYLLSPIKIESGPKLHAVAPILPSDNIAISLILALAGFAIVFLLEILAKGKKST